MFRRLYYTIDHLVASRLIGNKPEALLEVLALQIVVGHGALRSAAVLISMRALSRSLVDDCQGVTTTISLEKSDNSVWLDIFSKYLLPIMATFYRSCNFEPINNALLSMSDPRLYYTFSPYTSDIPLDV